MTAPKRCACGLPRVSGQRCLHGAEPGCDPITMRSRRAKAKRQQEAARIEAERGVGDSVELNRQLSKTVAKFDPIAAKAWNFRPSGRHAKGKRKMIGICKCGHVKTSHFTGSMVKGRHACLAVGADRKPCECRCYEDDVERGSEIKKDVTKGGN